MANTRMTPQRVQQVLKKHGKDITLDQAEEVLALMRKLARITVANYLREPAPKQEYVPNKK
ncbi:MAG: hypothetical protein WBP58_02975 [Chitinophagaceae bacterium]